MASNITAESVLTKISQDHLECPICSGRFTQPKLLECSHSFCLECLQQLRENSPITTRLSCPVCRQETLLNENGIDGLKTNLIVLSLIEAIETKETQLKQQQGKQVPSPEFVSKCSKHTANDLIMYCETCKKLICTTCIAKEHRMHPVIELNEASDKSKQHGTELLAEVRQRIKTYNIAIQKIDMSRKTLDSMFAATKEKISKKADEEIAKVAARIREEKQKLMQEAEQIYKDRVKTMETARATNSEEINKAEHKQDEVNQLMDQRIKIVHHIEQLLQDLKEYREKKSTKVPDGLTYMDFKEGQNSLGRLVLKDEQQVESATSAQARKPTFQSIKHFKQDKWTLKRKIDKYKNMKQKMVKIDRARDVAAYSNSDIVVAIWKNTSWITIPAESNPQSYVVSQELSIEVFTKFTSMAVNKNDELIVLDTEPVKIFNRNYQLLHQFNPGSEPSCIAVDDNNLIVVGHHTKAEISLHTPDGYVIGTLPAPGIGGYLTTYKQRLIYTNWNDKKLVSVTYNGEMVFSVDINQSGCPLGVCCDKDGSIYVAVWRGPLSSPGDIHHYSPDGKYIGCIIKDCAALNGLTFTPAGDLVVATLNSVQIYRHE
ncbi:tripartite motif-containing protein 2-like [Asterias rubens]|uniref:tripartite motif-containing protein 2-like n=1 Tax=Asterias rubens TaxID=7604 RepID=UPI001455C62A|nr:tripartite motif-containing protein 2-like [Asterias rubens]